MASGPKRLVIVEDDEQVRHIVERWALDAGFDVTAFGALDAARAYLKDHTPDVLVTDVRLGAFNGLQLVLVAKSVNPQVIAIVMSGYDDPVLRADAQRAGARYLQKPLERHSFVAALSP